MRVLVACEYSGIVRDAFLERGHDAMSCDLLPTESEGPHYQGDVLDILHDGWDLLIGHPPCDCISYAGIGRWNAPGRVYKRLEALKFFADLWEAPIEKICLENPRSCASPVIAKYSQEIQPHYFGDPHKKTTWLWLKNLPPLVHSYGTDMFGETTHVEPEYELQYRKPGKNYQGGEPKRRYKTDLSGARTGKARSKFWPSIAKAMAEQWG